MKPSPLVLSPSYLAYARGIRELHRLALEGKEDSPEADAVRDATDLPWEALTEVEKKRAAEMSEDLYSISEPSSVEPKPLNPQAQANFDAIFEARERGEWDRALRILRRWADYAAPSRVSFLRGALWLGAGDPETAALFYEHAWSLEPKNDKYLAAYLHVLKSVDPEEARRWADDILRDASAHDPAVIAHAAAIAIESLWPIPPSTEQTRRLRELIAVLKMTLARMNMEDDEESNVPAHSLMAGLLGLCHEDFGEHQAALNCYSLGLRFNPRDHVLLMHRGMLLYGESHQAVDDLRLAIEYGATDIWPYLFLAHHNLVGGEYDRCRSLCEQGMQLEGVQSAKSELAEWLAIARAELGFPADMVRSAFEEALRLDPSNDRARRNLATFESRDRPSAPRDFEKRSPKAVRASALIERGFKGAA